MLSLTYIWLALMIYGCAEANDDRPSFRSSLHEEGKPILRLGPSLSEEEDEPAENPHVARETGWVQDLKSQISNLVKKYGYIGAKSHIARLVDNAEKTLNILLRVVVTRDGDSTVTYKQTLRSAAGPAPTPPPAPQWLIDFKNFAKTLIERYSVEKIREYMEPVIRYLEKHQHVIIKDIDVDQFGEILVSWTTDSKHNIKYTK